MKKLLFSLLVFAIPAMAMQNPQGIKRKYEDQHASSITYTKPDISREIFSIKALDNNHEVGYCQAGVNPFAEHQGYIYALHVESQYRNKGIAYMLFKKGIEALIKKNYRVIAWDVIGIFNVSTRTLENIYLSMIMKLQQNFEFDFIMEERIKPLDTEVTPMRIILKGKR